jgi:iron complex outermembrane receptor protein
MLRTLVLSLFLISSLHADETKEKLDIVIIGARKKQENLQEIPVSATQITEKKLEDAGVTKVRDAVELAPNVMVVGSSSPRYTTPYIRGQGSQDAYIPDDSSVSFYLDEVPLPRYFFDSELIDIQKIEVLRGPQGTLFGKNTQAGAINLVTNDPNANDGHKISAEYGNLESKAISGTTNFKLFTDKLQNRFSITHKERDGWVKDTSLDRKLGDREVLAFHNTLTYTPDSTLKISLKLGLQEEEGTDAHVVARNVDGYPKTGYDTVPEYETNLYTSSLKVVKDFDKVVLTGIAAFNYYDFSINYDESDYYIVYPYISGIAEALSAPFRPLIYSQIDRTDVFYRKAKEYERQYFGELRLNNKDQDLSWTVGLNYSKTNFRLTSEVNTFVGLQTVPTPAVVYKTVNQDVSLLGTNISLFGEATKKLTDRFSLTLGGRVAYDEKEIKSNHRATNLAVTDYTQKSKEDYTDFVGKIALGHQTTQNINTYASVTRGYQAGGYPTYQINNYNGIAQDQAPYKKSTSLVYELGVKSELFDKRLRINSSLFYNDIKDKQVRVRTNTTPSIAFYDNADVDIYGAEIELDFKATKDIEIGTNFGYSNAKFKNAITSGTNNSVVNEKGARLANIPYWTNNTHIQFSRYFNFINGYLNFRTTYKYVGKRWGDNSNETQMGSHGLWNFRLGLDKERYSIALYMDNAFNKVYETQAYRLFDNEVSSPGLPRLYGIKATVNF